MKRFVLLFLTFSLVACASSTPYETVELPSGDVRYIVRCPGQFHQRCAQRARLACPQGYTIVETKKKREPRPVGSDPFYAETAMVISCIPRRG